MFIVHFHAPFLAMTMLKRVWRCSFGLTKTFVMIVSIKFESSSIHHILATVLDIHTLLRLDCQAAALEVMD